MKPPFSKLQVIFLHLLLHLSWLLPPCLSDQRYANCAPMEYRCGDVSINVSYPFRVDGRNDYCGHRDYFLTCTDNRSLTIKIAADIYQVKAVDFANHLISLVDRRFLAASTSYGDVCLVPLANMTVDFSLYEYSDRDVNLTFYSNCNASSLATDAFFRVDCGSEAYYSFDDASPYARAENCSWTTFSAVEAAAANSLGKGELGLGDALRGGFSLKWMAGREWCSNCTLSGGLCGYNIASPADHTCICPEGLVIGKCSSGANFGKRNIIIELKRITKSFSDKLGQGGYGTVFKGTLSDGHQVAVKVLSESKGNGEEFINEVASIGRTSHVNIVSLLGFCLEGTKRALVYDFMSNGSLEKYICGEKSDSMRSLSWETLYNIAIGIARGLEYLHRGCNTRIVHFDIKPHNILLDEDFCPKISDFGLAKLCPHKESILSMVGARGTIGYIAPEVFSRNFGVISSKSDIYSYGMMVLEMAGGRKNSSTRVNKYSEFYFPHWIYEHLDKHGTLQDWGTTAETEEIARKMILVGLWCIQTMPTNRPSIVRVVEMLSGSITDLHMPPKPYLSSPIISALGSKATSTS